MCYDAAKKYAEQAGAKRPLRLERYRPEHAAAWDSLVDKALNGHLLFYRGFMDYHQDRFRDHSLLVWLGEALAAVFPANEGQGCLCSHQGLTFGGLIHGENFYAADMLHFYDSLKAYMRHAGFARLLAKPVPFPYTRAACQSQEYALWRAGGRVIERHLSAALDLRSPLSMSALRLRGARKAVKAGIKIAESEDFAAFLTLLSGVLARHGACPKHTVSELELLKKRFPEAIRLICALRGQDMLAATLVFFTPVAAHTQYLCASPEGQGLGALDLLIKTLAEAERGKRSYLCFGISTEDDGTVLNTGLMHQKEGFGARGFLHEIYALDA